MREQYLRAVRRLLPRKVRQAVVRDLEERFDAAADHGESEADVIARLGTPEELAAPFREGRTPALWPPLLLAGLGLLVSAACGLGLWLQAQLGGEDVGVIGGADGPTRIYVTSGGVSPLWLLLALGLALLAAGLLWLRRRGLQR